MTTNQLLNQFSGDTPAFFCAADGTIVLENKPAEKHFKSRIVGEKITKYFSAYDTLRFEFSLQSKKPRPFTAAAKLISGNYYLAILPGSIGFTPFAIVLATGSEAEANDIIAAPPKDDSKDISALIEKLATSCFMEQSTIKALFDPAKTIEKLIADLESIKYLPLEFELSEASDSKGLLASDMGLGSFVHIFIVSAIIINHITSDGKMNVSVSPLGDMFEMRLGTKVNSPIFGEGCEAIASKYPTCGFALTLLEFMAAHSGCTLTVYCKGEDILISIISEEITEHIDFKSYDQFTEYNCIFASAIDSLGAICKEAGQA